MVKKSDFFWNMLYTGLAATLSFVIMLVCVRANGVEVAGQVAILFATATIVGTIGEYGLRLYQVTDVERRYTFNDYIITRIILVTLMFVAGIAIIVISGYEKNVAVIFSLFVLIKAIDNLSDTFQGELQLIGKLDIASKYAFIRTVIYVLVFSILDIVTHNVIFALSSSFLVNVLLFILFDIFTFKKYISEKLSLKLEKKKVVRILKACFNIFAFTILSTYIINAVKYIIDRNSTYEMQTYYNIIYLPMFILNLVSIFIIKPYLQPISKLLLEKKHREFVKSVGKMLITLLILAVILLISVYLFGTTVLEVIYGVELSCFKIELVIIGGAGVLYAISMILYNILVTMRKLKGITLVYVIVFLISFGMKYMDLGEITITKSVMYNVVIMLVLCALTIIEFSRQVYRRKK